MFFVLDDTDPARARWESCVAHDRKVAMLAWELKLALNGDRSDFLVNRISGFLCWTTQTPPRARAPALGVLYCTQ